MKNYRYPVSQLLTNSAIAYPEGHNLTVPPLKEPPMALHTCRRCHGAAQVDKLWREMKVRYFISLTMAASACHRAGSDPIVEAHDNIEQQINFSWARKCKPSLYIWPQLQYVTPFHAN